MKKERIVITGGHYTPALALIEELVTSYQLPVTSFYWMGRKCIGGKPSPEYNAIAKKGIPFYGIHAGKLYKTYNPLKLLRIPWGLFEALFYLLRIRPHLILSFGGYIAVPVVLAGWILRIPSVTHEQTVVSGWANRFIAHFASKIFISWPRSRQFFPEEKTVLTGNPVREEIFQVKKPFHPKPSTLNPTIYITGGKLGSRVINQAVAKALPKLLEKFNVIHQCGSRDWERLKEKEQEGYVVKDYFSEEEIGSVFATSDFVISRAGANAITELAALGKPAILIPIPWSSHGEQQKNAQLLKNVGLAEILPEKNLTSHSLLEYCEKMVQNLEEYKKAGEEAKNLVRPDAAHLMAKEIISLLT